MIRKIVNTFPKSEFRQLPHILFLIWQLSALINEYTVTGDSYLNMVVL